MLPRISSWIGKAVARYLSAPVANYRPLTTALPSQLASTLRPADVLLVEGNTRISNAIKYLTQSTWSHAALYVGAIQNASVDGEDEPVLVEVDMVNGVTAVPLSTYAAFHTRICRPAALAAEDSSRVIEYVVSRLGQQYDLKNLIDLARYLLPTPPLPRRWRRRMMALGSGDPTKAICSTLIAQAFQSVSYPILPDMIRRRDNPGADDHNRELLTIRHFSLYSPRDFDISPYFEVVKPSIEHGIAYRSTERKQAPTAGRDQPQTATPNAGSVDLNLAPEPVIREGWSHPAAGSDQQAEAACATREHAGKIAETFSNAAT